MACRRASPRRGAISTRCAGWTGYVFTGNLALELTDHRFGGVHHVLFNGFQADLGGADLPFRRRGDDP